MQVQTAITVVEHDGELLFRNKEGKLFDILFADGFEGGKLWVFRDGDLIAETSSIRHSGGHVESVCFYGLDGLLQPSPDKSATTNALAPNNFQSGDVLILSFEFPVTGDKNNYVWGMPSSEGVLRLS